MADLVRNLQVLGYQRPGLVMLDEQDRSHNHIQRSVVSDWQIQLPYPDQIPHLIQSELKKSDFHKWLDKYQPDVVISGYDYAQDWILESGRSIPGNMGFARPQITEKKKLSGIRYDHLAMGQAAVDIISGQIMSNERGAPDVPKNVLIAGHWQKGLSLRQLNIP
jgi:hypothetical protein